MRRPKPGKQAKSIHLRCQLGSDEEVIKTAALRGRGSLCTGPESFKFIPGQNIRADAIGAGHTLAISKGLIGAGAGATCSSRSCTANPTRAEGCEECDGVTGAYRIWRESFHAVFSQEWKHRLTSLINHLPGLGWETSPTPR